MVQTSPLSRLVIGCAIEVHRALGAGLLESAYRTCLAHELLVRGAAVAVEVPVPLVYKGQRLECGFRADLIVDEILLVEIKSVEYLRPIHSAQVQTYLRLLDLPQGLIFNFNEMRLSNGIRSVLNASWSAHLKRGGRGDDEAVEGGFSK
jgi:GxxExxY protein